NWVFHRSMKNRSKFFTLKTTGTTCNRRVSLGLSSFCRRASRSRSQLTCSSRVDLAPRPAMPLTLRFPPFEPSRHSRSMAAGPAVVPGCLFADVPLPAAAVHLLDDADETDQAIRDEALGADDLPPLHPLVAVDPEVELVAGRFVLRRGRHPAQRVGFTRRDG